LTEENLPDVLQLVAMGGERMFSGSFREISSVGTHPNYRGRGYARAIINKLIAEHQKNKRFHSSDCSNSTTPTRVSKLKTNTNKPANQILCSGLIGA